MWLTTCLWGTEISPCQGSCIFDWHSDTARCYIYDYNNTYNQGDISSLRRTFGSDLLDLALYYGWKEVLFEVYRAPQPRLNIAPPEDGGISFDWAMPFNRTADIYTFALLERLDIHIPLRKIDGDLFKHMKHLKYMNLSHTYGLKSSDISQVLQALSNAGAPLEHLDLSWSRCFPDLLCDTISIRDHILINLASFPLKVLDMRGIEFLEFDAGFAEFTPGLEKLYLGDYQNPVKNREMEYCIWLDISILPNITEVVFDLGPWNNLNPGDLPCRGAWDELHLATNMNIHLVNGTVPHCSALYEDNACRLSRCECYNKINNYPFLLDYIQNLSYREVDYIYGVFPPFPVPPKLRHLSISPVELQFREGYLNVLQHNISLTHLRYRLHTANSYRWNSLRSELKYLKGQIGGVGLHTIGGIWNNMPKLEVLYLGLTQLTFFWQDTFLRACPNLRHLNLSGCGIKSVGFLNLTKLQSLDLSRNRLHDLPRHVTAFLDSRAVQGGLKLQLSQNELHCDCNNQEFFRWMVNTKVHFPDQDDIRCLHPRRGWISPWHIDPVEVRHCRDFYLIFTAVGSGFGSICFLLLLLVVVRKWWTIRYWLHAARTSWKTKQSSNAGCRRDYRYSAFVAYCSKDKEERQWVHLTLAPKLEQEYGFKLCMHHRDFMIGKDIADNIVEAIHDSNKVLLILSPTFLESDWCQFEVRMAREKTIRDGRDSLVLVIYKRLDVPGARLPRKLIRILEKKTYAEWTTDDVGQELFWKKLNNTLKETRHEPYVDVANVAPSHDKETDQEYQVLMA